jgi:hypothetical protein
MLRLFVVLIIFCVVTLASARDADARWFEPQANWRHAGALCVASRKPPARRWRAIPPRACAVSDSAEVRKVAEPVAAVEVIELSLAPIPDWTTNLADLGLT